jgi:cytochrome P450
MSLYHRKWKYRSLTGIPSPPGNILLGNLPQLMKVIRTNRLYLQLSEWAATYGSVYTFWFVGSPSVVVSRPRVIEELLVRQQKDGSLIRHQQSSRVWETVFGGDTMENQTAEEWQWRRQTWAPSFTQKQLMEEQYETVLRNSASLRDQLRRFADAGSIVYTDRVFALYAMQIICEMMFTNCGTTGLPAIDYAALYDAIDVCERQIVVEYSPQRWLKYLPLPASARYWKARRYVQATIEPYVDYALRARGAPPGSADETMVREAHRTSLLLQIAIKQPRYTKQSLAAETFLTLAAGSDTTAHSLSFALGILALHPTVFERARDEVDACWDEGVRGGITANRLASLKYVRGVVCEAIRLFPVGGGSFPCTVLKDIEVEGHKIPKGVEVFWSLMAAGRDPEEYPDPDRVVPERWMGSKTPRMLSFGSGAHRCLGERLAIMEATLVTALLLREFDWALVNGSASLEKLVHKFVVCPEDRMPLRFTVRQFGEQAVSA